MLEEEDQPVAEEEAHALDVDRRARHQLAGLVAVEVAEREAQELGVEPAPQVEVRPRAPGMPEISRRPNGAAAFTTPDRRAPRAIGHGSSDCRRPAIAFTTSPVSHGNASEPSWLIDREPDERTSVSL